MSETRVRFDPAAGSRPIRGIDRLQRIPVRFVLPILSFGFACAVHLVLSTIAAPSAHLAPSLAAASADLAQCTVTVAHTNPTTGTVQVLTVESRAHDTEFAVALLGPAAQVLVDRTDAAGHAALTVPIGPTPEAGIVTVEVQIDGGHCSTSYTPRGR